MKPLMITLIVVLLATGSSFGQMGGGHMGGGTGTGHMDGGYYGGGMGYGSMALAA